MTDRTHPDSGRTTGGIVEMLHARIAALEQEVAHTDGLLGKANALAHIRAHHIAELEAQLEAIGAGGVSPLIGQQTSDTFTAADMATASAQGFRDGAASVAASAGIEPVKRVFLVATGEEYEGEATYTRYDDSPPPLCDSECLYTHPSPPEGMVGGWQDIATAPKDGARILLHPAVEVHDSWSKGHWSEPQECWIVGGSASGVAHTYWLPLPPSPPTTTAGSGKGE